MSKCSKHDHNRSGLAEYFNQNDTTLLLRCPPMGILQKVGGHLTPLVPTFESTQE